MKQHYLKTAWLVLLLSLLGAASAQAQSGPYGNEWLLPGQQYYKIKVARDGIYRLDYQYLQKAGIGNGNPAQLQLWRRGKEVAIHVGGNPSTLDASSFVEFFGQRNDAALDRNMFKQPSDQAQTYYSLFTDTAAYFLTWSKGAPGLRMVQSNPTPAVAPHPSRVRQQLDIYSNLFYVVNDERGYNTYQSWGELGEGFFSSPINPSLALNIDSVWAPKPGQPLRLELRLVGRRTGPHKTRISVTGADGAKRELATVDFEGLNYVDLTYELRPTDRTTAGRVSLTFEQLLGKTVNRDYGDQAGVAYTRLTYAQDSHWFRKRTQQLFSNDSTLTGPAYYLLDSVAAGLRGYDVTNPYAVQRVEGRPGSGPNQRGFVFAQATAGTTRNLLLAEADRGLVPLPAQRVVFRNINPAAATYIIVSSNVLMKPAGSGPTAVADPVRAYAQYRASTGYDTLVVTSEQLYDQFHYGEESPLAVRQFAQWMLANNSRPMALLLLGRGVSVNEAISCGDYYRRKRETYGDCSGQNPVRNLVPASTRGPSDIFFTADWQKGDYRARMLTGRVSALQPQQVLNYLNKVKEHESLGYEPWRRNVLHLVGSEKPEEAIEYGSYLDKYATYVRKPPFGGTVVKTYRRSDYPGVAPGDTPPLNMAREFNEGLSFISYFGHGYSLALAWNIADINNPANGFANKGKYPIWYVSGCAAGNAFRPEISFGGEQYMLAQDKGIVGFLADSDLGFASDLDAIHTEMVKLLFSDEQWYGKPVTEVQREVTRRLQQNAPPSLIGGLMNNVWQGDPVLKLFSPLKPDFQTADTRLRIPAGVTVATPSFELQVGVSNPGRVTTGTLEIRVTRSFSSGRPAEAPFIVTVPQARRDTVYSITIAKPAGNIAGLNTFLVELDPNNKIDESDETNNSARLDYSFLTGGVTTLSPSEFGIVGSPAVRLVGQSNLVATTAREFELELDTVQTFSSPLLQRTTVTAVQTPEWRPTLPTVASRPDSLVWYWRLRLRTPQGDENAEWAVSSFRVIKGRTQGGWSQSHPGQFRRDERSGGEVSLPGGQWTLEPNSLETVVTSTRIGPARQWETLYHTIRPDAAGGSYTLRLLGIDSLGTTVVLNPDVSSRSLNITSVSGAQYPYLQLQAVLRSPSTGGSLPQLEQWLITYQGIPEGVVRRDAALAASPTAYDAATLTAQARTGTLTVPVVFENVADYDFKAPLVARVRIRDSNNRTVERNVVFTGPPLLAHSQQSYEVKVNVIGLNGTLSGQITMNPRRQPELYYFNNELELPSFEATDNDTPPVLDVAFDGRHLLNGEIVSPRPVISVQLRDLDKLRPIQDRNNFILVLTRPGGAGQPIDLNAAGITFVGDSARGTARLEYQPGKAQPLTDGVYTLEVQGRDGSGKLAGTEPYRITFEVISSAGITNVFPYPNPVTSKTRFVFTLTGTTPPRNMKIQIVSLTGRVVKEIMMEEMGPLRIGNNITEQYWDGTDTYGDRLANGTYLYRVVLDDPTGEFKQRATAADKAFKKDWGKLVLLR